MTRHTLILAAASLLIAAPFGAGAAPSATADAVRLEAVVVTPSARYTAAEWQARQAKRQLAAAQAAPVVLEAVVVTPARRYTLAQWQARSDERRYARHEISKARHWLNAVWRRLGLTSRPQAV